MHAAVWSHGSHPIPHSKFHRVESEVKVPGSLAGRVVLGISITSTLIGGLLIVFGITGFFVRGDTKLSLGFATIPGIIVLITGITGTRAVSHWRAAKKYTNIFTTMSILSTLSCIILTILSAIVLTDPPLLLTIVIATGETALGALGSLISLSGTIVAIIGRSILQNPLGDDDSDDNRRKYRYDPTGAVFSPIGIGTLQTISASASASNDGTNNAELNNK